METKMAYNAPFMVKDVAQFNLESVVFEPLLATDSAAIIEVAFKAGQMLPEHKAPAKVMVMVLDGEIDFTIDGNVNRINSGEAIMMRPETFHSVKALKDSKVMLIKMKE